MKKLEFYIEDSGEIIIGNDGVELTIEDEPVAYVSQFLMLESIKDKLLQDERIRNNEEMQENLSLIVRNYYIERMIMIENNHTQLLRLAICDTNEDLAAVEPVLEDDHLLSDYDE